MDLCCVRLRCCGSIDFDVLFLDPMRQTAYAWRLRAGIDPADSCEGCVVSAMCLLSDVTIIGVSQLKTLS